MPGILCSCGEYCWRPRNYRRHLRFSCSLQKREDWENEPECSVSPPQHYQHTTPAPVAAAPSPPKAVNTASGPADVPSSSPTVDVPSSSSVPAVAAPTAASSPPMVVHTAAAPADASSSPAHPEAQPSSPAHPDAQPSSSPAVDVSSSSPVPVAATTTAAPSLIFVPAPDNEPLPPCVDIGVQAEGEYNPRSRVTAIDLDRVCLFYMFRAQRSLVGILPRPKNQTHATYLVASYLVALRLVPEAHRHTGMAGFF